MEHVILNKSASEDMNNKMTYSTIVESLFSLTTLHFTSTSHSNTTITQNWVTVVKLRPLKLLPENSSDLKYTRI
jgi:hypothetical protein